MALFSAWHTFVIQRYSNDLWRGMSLSLIGTVRKRRQYIPIIFNQRTGIKNRSESSFVCTYSDDSHEPAHRRVQFRNDVI